MATVSDDIQGGSLPAVSWPAVLAGAVAAAALSLILLVLGTGLGLSAVSPWAGNGASATAITWSTIAWIVFTAVAASGLGGYIAGRMRIKWPSVHTDEVYFRDTVHGFLAWAVATLVTAAVLTTAIGTILSAGAVAGATAGGAAVAAATSGTDVLKEDEGPAVGMNGSGQPNQQPAYTLDSLFRVTAGSVPETTAAQSAAVASVGNETLRETKREIAEIFSNGLESGQLSADDARYAAQLVAQRTGLNPQDAEARVNDVFSASYKKLQDAKTKAKDLADAARKNAAYASLWIFVSLLSGAFVASLLAAIGGRRRDLF